MWIDAVTRVLMVCTFVGSRGFNAFSRSAAQPLPTRFLPGSIFFRRAEPFMEFSLVAAWSAARAHANARSSRDRGPARL